MNPSISSPFGSHQGANLADVNALLRLTEGQTKKSSYLQEAVRELYLHYRDLEKVVWRELILAGEQVSRFHQGQQLITPNPFLPGRWIPYNVTSPGSGERRALSIMQWHFTTCIEKWLTSNPDVRFRPGVQSDEAAEAAEAAKLISKHYDSQFYGVEISIQEALMGLCYGSYIWRLKIDQTKPITAWKEIFGEQEVALGDGYGKCGDCPKEGKASEFPDEMCPECGGQAQVEPPATQIVPVVTGKEPVQLGDFALELVPFPSCRWDLHTTADLSEWMIVERRTSMTAVRQVLGNMTIPGSPSSNIGLDVIDRMAYTGQAQSGHSSVVGTRKPYKEPVSVEEFWCSPSQYGDIRLNRPIQTVDGQTIPANERLGDLLNGQNLCFLGLNEMATVLGVFVEDHRDYVTQGVWYSKQGSGAGRGQQDLVEVQKRLNADDQQLHNFWRASSTPSLLVLSEILGEEGKGEYLGWGAENIPVSRVNLPEGMGLKDVVAPAFQPGTASGQMVEYVYRRLEEYAQKASHAMNMTSGLPGVNNETATGANITQAVQSGLYLPPLSIKGEIRLKNFLKLLKLYPKQFPIDRYFPLGGKFNQSSGKYLNGANLNQDIIGEVVPDSQNPRNSYMKRTDYMAFGQLLGALAVLPQYLTPDRIDDMERTFDLEMESETRNVAHALCFRRLRQMQNAAGMINDPMMLIQQIKPPVIAPSVDPQTGQQTIGPSVEFIVEPAHDVKAQWYAEWLDSDEGCEAPDVLRAAAAQMVKLHFGAKGMADSAMAAQQGSVEVAAQAPVALAQHLAGQAMQQNQQPEPPSADTQMDMANEEAQRKHEAQESEKDRQHELQTKKIDVSLKRSEHQNKIQLAKMKPKPEPVGKK